MQANSTQTARIPLATRLASSLVLGYFRRCPIRPGKGRLMRVANRFLVVELAPDVFIRILGMSHVELAIARDGIFESETVELFLDLLAPGMTVLDIGANVGMYTLLAAQRVGPTGYVHAFEPTHHVAAKLVANIRLNGFGNVTVNEIAVSDCSSEATLYYVEDDGMNNILAPEPGYRHSMKVLTVTLDEYLDSRQTEKVDIIKMDIEGAELKALRGAARLLAGDDAPVVIVEINPRALAVGNATAAELVQLLEGHGYRVGTIATYGVTTRDPWLNAIAFKPMHERRWPALGERRFQPIGMK